MTLNSRLIHRATFNPKIKIYLLFVVAFFLLISILGIPLLIIWFFGLGQYISKHYYNNLRCELTSNHLEFSKGVLFKIEKTIPLENIQDLTFIENPLLKYLKLRILKIETAGQSNPKRGDMKLIGIIDSYYFKEKILRQRETLIKRNDLDSVQQSFSDEKSIGLLIEIRDLLKVINDKKR